MDDLHRRLREAADAHQPDRDAMLARIERGMADATGADRARLYRRRRQASWLKVSLAGIAGVGVLGLGGLAVAAGVQQGAPQRPNPPVATPTDDTGPAGNAATASPKPRASATKPTAAPPATSHHSATPTPTPTPTPTVSADGPLAAQGDVNAHSTVYWEQNDLTVAVAQPLSSLTVELRIAQTGGVDSTGAWQTAPTDDYTISVTHTDGFVVYRWVLKPGHTVPGSSQQVFAAQFNHDTGKRDASKDTFHVETSAGGRTAAVGGGFAAAG